MAWSYEAKLLASDASNYDRFGLSVGITDNTAVIGAIYAGAAYTFHRQGTQWIELAKLSQLPATYEAYFGYGVATDGTLVAVGAPEFASVYVFQPPKADCNENDIPDLCDVRDGTSADCNHDDVPDLCTLTDGTTPDCNQSGIPDDCESQLPFDYDLDGGVDLIDLAGFQRCFTSEGQVTVAPCCTVFDSEPDGDVDLIDFVAFGGAFLGP